MKVIFVVLLWCAVLYFWGCAPVQKPVVVDASWARAIWKTKNCGLGVSFDACERAWRAR